MKYQKYKKTSEQIKELFMEMLKKEPIERISITEICQTLQINRSTFYRHYEDIFALYRSIENDFMVQLENLHHKIAISPVTSYQAMVQILNFIKDNKEFFSIFMIYSNSSGLWEGLHRSSTKLFLYKIYQKYPGSKEADANELQSTVEFVSSGFYTLYRKWISEDCKESVESLAIRLATLSDLCIEHSLNTN